MKKELRKFGTQHPLIAITVIMIVITSIVGVNTLSKANNQTNKLYIQYEISCSHYDAWSHAVTWLNASETNGTCNQLHYAIEFPDGTYEEELLVRNESNYVAWGQYGIEKIINRTYLTGVENDYFYIEWSDSPTWILTTRTIIYPNESVTDANGEFNHSANALIHFIKINVDVHPIDNESCILAIEMTEYNFYPEINVRFTYEDVKNYDPEGGNWHCRLME